MRTRGLHSCGPPARRSPSPTRAGAVLIIVLWIAFGLVSLTLYFAHSMSFEMHAADNRVAALEAEQAIAGAGQYVSALLTQLETNGMVPDVARYQSEAVTVGQARFWLLGRTIQVTVPTQPYFGLVDEASKLNLNTATLEMLEGLPRMTPAQAAAIIDWRDADSNLSPDGAESETYQRLIPPYQCKNAPFETVDELRLVYGMDLETLYGEDTNLNGFLDPNEDDGERTPPLDNRDGRLDPGVLEYVTVYSREPNTRSDGSRRINLNGGNASQLTTLLREKFGQARATQIQVQPRGGGAFRSVLDFYVRSRCTAEEFAQIEADLTVSDAAYLPGLVNVGTASETVLACLPGIGVEGASTLVAYRQAHPDKLTSVAWVTEALEQNAALAAGPYLTARSYQFTADVAAVGHYGRGYRRAKFVFDTSEGTPKVLYRQDLSHIGWALGRTVQQELQLAMGTRSTLAGRIGTSQR